METIPDELWDEIVRACNPEDFLRLTLSEMVREHRFFYNYYKNPENYHSVKDDLDEMILATEKLQKLLDSIKHHTERAIFNNAKPEDMLKHTKRVREIPPDFKFQSYFYNEIRRFALPILKSALECAKNTAKRKGGLTEERRMKIRKDAISGIDAQLYFFSKTFLKRGKNASTPWVHSVLKLIDPHVTISSTDKLIQERIKWRNTYWDGGVEGYIRELDDREPKVRENLSAEPVKMVLRRMDVRELLG